MLMHTKHAYLGLAICYSVLNIVSDAAMAVVWMRDVLIVQDKWESQCPQHSDGPAVDGLIKPR